MLDARFSLPISLKLARGKAVFDEHAGLASIHLSEICHEEMVDDPSDLVIGRVRNTNTKEQTQLFPCRAAATRRRKVDGKGLSGDGGADTIAASISAGLANASGLLKSTKQLPDGQDFRLLQIVVASLVCGFRPSGRLFLPDVVY